MGFRAHCRELSPKWRIWLWQSLSCYGPRSAEWTWYGHGTTPVCPLAVTNAKQCQDHREPGTGRDANYNQDREIWPITASVSHWLPFKSWFCFLLGANILSSRANSSRSFSFLILPRKSQIFCSVWVGEPFHVALRLLVKPLQVACEKCQHVFLKKRDRQINEVWYFILSSIMGK